MNTVNETKTFSSLPEEESALWERMRDTLLCLQTDNSISVKDLASRLAYSTQEFLYLADIFCDNSLDTIREQVQGLNIEEDYTNQVLPFERIPDSSMIEYKVVREASFLWRTVAFSMKRGAFLWRIMSLAGFFLLVWIGQILYDSKKGVR